MFYVDYIFFLYIKKTKKKNRKKDIIAHYLAHTRKSGSCLRKARVPEYQLHAILMYIFMMSKKKNNKKKDDLKETILSTESYGFQKKRKYLLFLNP